jgi:biotin-(acetyl-CoA carboxylase) ligase
MLDRVIEVRGGDGAFEATARGVNERGALIVEMPDGRMRTLFSEDVRITL